MKTTISRGRNDNFDSRGCKFIKEDFSSGENEKKIRSWMEFSPILRVLLNGLGGQRGIIWQIVLLDTILYYRI